MDYYRRLLSEASRIEAFREAIGQVVHPGDRVLEVGTGVGTFAFFAARAGAERVWAVDGDPVVHVARAIAEQNGLADRVECIRGWIPDVTLPAPADVIIFEDFPPRFWDARIANMLGLLRQRYAHRETRWIPGEARLFMAPAGGPALRALVAPFGADDAAHGIDWSASRGYVANQVHHPDLDAGHLLAPALPAGTVSLGAPPAAGLSVQGSWTMASPAAVDGLALWFDLALAPGVTLTNEPGRLPGSWGRAFLPADPPLTLGAGDVLEAAVRTETTELGEPGWLAWDLTAGPEARQGHEFRAQPAALGDLLAGSLDGVPTLTSSGALMREVLGLTDGTRSADDIAEALQRVYPALDGTAARRAVLDVLRGRATARPPEGDGGHDP